MEVNRLRFLDAILDLCVYHYPPNIQLPSGLVHNKNLYQILFYCKIILLLHKEKKRSMIDDK